MPDQPSAFTRVPQDKPPAAPRSAAPPGRPVGVKATKALVELIPFPKLKETLESYYLGASIALMPVLPATAMVVGANASKCAEVWVDYAKASPAAHKMISKMLTGIGIGTVLAAHLPIVMAAMSEQKIPRDQRMMAVMLAQQETSDAA